MTRRMKRIRRSSSPLALLWIAAFAAACQGERPVASHSDPAETVSAVEREAYDVRGRLLEIRKGGLEVLIEHEAIPGRMAAMTMPFALKSPVDEKQLKEGDPVAFQYIVSGAAVWIDSVRRLDPGETNLDLASSPEFVPHSEASLYQMDEIWTNQKGRRMALEELQGGAVVMSMVFTSCGYACPMIVSDMHAIAGALPDELGDRVQYVLVSLDPERDTVDALREFAKAYRLDEDNWTLLRGEADQVRMLAALLGIRYRRQADGQFAHTSLISVLDEHGEIVYQKKGTGTNAEATVVLLDLLSGEGPS